MISALLLSKGVVSRKLLQLLDGFQVELVVVSRVVGQVLRCFVDVSYLGYLDVVRWCQSLAEVFLKHSYITRQ